MVEVTYSICILFAFKLLQGICSLKLFPLFATGVFDTGGKFATAINNTSETCGNFLPVSLTPAANLPPVVLIPVVHLVLRKSPRIFPKNSKRS
jgi:hypothetical protein